MGLSQFTQLKCIFHYLLPKQFLTKLAGWLAEAKTPWLKNYLIKHFLKKHPVNLKEAVQENYQAYASFNDFFVRHLKPGARTIEAADIISPVDGFVSAFGAIKKGMLIQAKGHEYSVDELLVSDRAAQFKQGAFATLYLSPSDYHRVHMPVSGKILEMHHVPGRLFSVQPLTTAHIPKLFAKNERLVTFFETEHGPVAVVLVGATIVGKIGTVWQGDLNRQSKIQTFDVSDFSPQHLQQADELGYFKLGSTAIILFSNPVQWQKMSAGMSIRLGQALGQFKLGE